MRQVKAKRLRKLAVAHIAEIEAKKGTLQKGYKVSYTKNGHAIHTYPVNINRIHRARRAYIRKLRMTNMVGKAKSPKRY
jgi:hypothetical protein